MAVFKLLEVRLCKLNMFINNVIMHDKTEYCEVKRLIRSKNLGIIALALWYFTADAWACDVAIPERGSVVEWPDKYLAAEVKVLKIWHVSLIDHRALVHVLRRIKGNLPNKFIVNYDTSSCGEFFAKGKIQTSGFVLSSDRRRKGSYRFEVITHGVFFDTRVRLPLLSGLAVGVIRQ